MQFYRRLWFRFSLPRVDRSPAPLLRDRSLNWLPPARREPSLIGPGHFIFLGNEGCLAELGWDGDQREKLWRYNQHYFDDLNAIDNQQRHAWHQSLLLDWIVNNEPGKGNAWEPYPTSLRIVNWIKWSLSGNSLAIQCIDSLAVQARWLVKRLEYHLLGNHLFSNAKALVFAGSFFDGKEADSWLKLGLQILDQQITEQILEDGGHIERSTMYHALALEDMLDLCNLFECYSKVLVPGVSERLDLWRSVSKRMLDWIKVLQHPDGDISFFNDAAIGIAPSISELSMYAHQLGIFVDDFRVDVSRYLMDSGYVRLANERAVCFLDLAPLGPDYLLGHAHADTLSFELSVFGQRLLVNSGTSCYGMSSERLRQRGTTAHNTVTVLDKDSSEVWGGFRVARRAKIIRNNVNLAGCFLSVEGSHDGYKALPGKPIHHRKWEMGSGFIKIQDRIDHIGIPAVARFHFHPSVSVESNDNYFSGSLKLPGGQNITWIVEQGSPSLQVSTWHPSFGVSLKNMCLVVKLQSGASSLALTWN